MRSDHWNFLANLLGAPSPADTSKKKQEKPAKPDKSPHEIQAAPSQPSGEEILDALATTVPPQTLPGFGHAAGDDEPWPASSLLKGDVTPQPAETYSEPVADEPVSELDSTWGGLAAELGIASSPPSSPTPRHRQATPDSSTNERRERPGAPRLKPNRGGGFGSGLGLDSSEDETSDAAPEGSASASLDLDAEPVTDRPNRQRQVSERGRTESRDSQPHRSHRVESVDESRGRRSSERSERARHEPESRESRHRRSERSVARDDQDVEDLDDPTGFEAGVELIGWDNPDLLERDDDRFELDEVDEMALDIESEPETESETEPTPSRRRRRGRRGARQRMGDEPARPGAERAGSERAGSERAAAPRSTADRLTADAEPRRSRRPDAEPRGRGAERRGPREPRREDVDFDSDLEADLPGEESSIVEPRRATDESDQETPRSRTRRRGRRGRGRGRDGQTPAAGELDRAIVEPVQRTSAFDDDHEDDFEVDEIRRGHHTRSRDRDRESGPRDESIDRGRAKPEKDEVDRPARSRTREVERDTDDEPAEDRSQRRAPIPTWIETVDLLVNANIENHKKSKGNGGGGGGGGRGSRGGRRR